MSSSSNINPSNVSNGSLGKRGNVNNDNQAKRNRVNLPPEDRLKIATLAAQARENLKAAHATSDLTNRNFLLELATNALDRVFKLDPASSEGWETRILVCASFNRRGLAQILVKAQEACREDVEVLNTVGVAYLESENWAQAFACFKKGVKSGDATALYYTGWLYKYHPATERDVEKATDLFKRASATNIPAKYEYALYLTRDGAAPEELSQGRRLMKEASDQNHPLASYEYACILSEQGTLEEKRSARTLFWKLAEQGHTHSKHNYAYMLKNGSGYNGGPSDEDLVTARTFFKDAYEDGYIPSRLEYASMLEQGIGGPAQPEQARILYKKGSDDGCESSRYNLALMLLEARGGPKDEKRARSLLSTGEELLSKYMYAHFLLEGTGSDEPVSQAERQQAREILGEIAEQHIPALNDYASLWEEGIGGPKDEVEARRLYNSAHLRNADNDYWIPTYSLGLMVLEGRGGYKDPAEAKEFFKRGADRSDIKCLTKYIEMLIATNNFAEAKVYADKAKQLPEKNALLHKIALAEAEQVRLHELARKAEIRRKANEEIQRIEDEAQAKKQAIRDKLNADLGENPASMLMNLANAADKK